MLLLHGIPTSAFLWRRIGPTLSAKGFRAFAPDLLGYGKSGDPSSEKFGIVDQSRYVHQFITGLGLRDVIVVGHGTGGGIAQHLAVGYPELVIGLVLVDTIADGNWPSWPMRLLRLRPFGAAAPLVDATVGFERALARGMKSAMRHPARLTPQSVETYAAPLAARGGSAHVARLARHVTPADTEGLTAKLAASSVPVLVIWGEHDPYLKPASGKQLAEALPGAELIEIPDCGHYVPEEAPFELAEAMLPFLVARQAVREARTTGRSRRTGDLAKPDKSSE